MRTQLTNRDREGMNIVMLAARSSSMAVLGALLTEIDQTEVGEAANIKRTPYP